MTKFYIDLDKGPCQKDCPWRRMSCLHFQNSRNMAVKHPKLNTAAAIWWRLCAPRGASQVTTAFLYASAQWTPSVKMPLLNFRNSNEHFAVGFFHNPTLRPLLELMFPEHNVLHLLAQNFLSPSETVWNKVKDFYETYLLQATSECSCKNPKVSIVSTLMKWSPLCKEQVLAAPHWDGGGARERTYKQILESLEYIQIHHSLCLLSCGWPLRESMGKLETCWCNPR